MQIELHKKPPAEGEKKTTNFTSFPTRTAEEEQEIAKGSGWKNNKEEVEKEGKQFIEADEFNRRGELLKTVSKQSRAIKNLERKIAEQEKQDAHFQTMHQQEVQRAYEKAKADLKEQKLEFIESGEHKQAALVESKLEEMGEAYEREQKEAKQKASQGKLPPEVQSWLDDDRNEWYHNDEDLAAAFDGMLAKQIKANAGKPIKEIMEIAEARFTKLHPDVYEAVEEEEQEEEEEQPKKRVSKVAAPTGSGKKKPAGRKFTWFDLPDDVKPIAQGFVDMGTFKTRQAYVDKYFAKFGKDG